MRPNFQNLGDVDIEDRGFAVPSFAEILESLGVRKVGDLARFVLVEEAGFEADVVRELRRLGCTNLRGVMNLKRRDLKQGNDSGLRLWLSINRTLVTVGLPEIDQ